MRDGLRRHTGQPLYLHDDCLAVGQLVAEGGRLLPRHPGHLLVTPLLHLLVPGQVQDDPQQRGGGGLGPRFEQVQAGQLQRLHVEVWVGPLYHLQQVHVNKVSR